MINSHFELADKDRILLGEGLFETIQVKDSYSLHLDRHYLRLTKSSQALGINCPYSYGDFLTLIQDKIKASQIIHGGVKVILSGGDASRGLVENGINNKLIIQAFNYNKSLKPVKLKKASWNRDKNNPLYRHKTINYLESILARKEALAQGYDDAIFCNLEANVTEATCANIFMIKNDEIITPAMEEGILAGITRARLIEYCHDEDIPCQEKPIHFQMLEQFEAAFLTSSLQGVLAIEQIEQKQMNTQHPILSILQSEFN